MAGQNIQFWWSSYSRYVLFEDSERELGDVFWDENVASSSLSSNQTGRTGDEGLGVCTIDCSCTSSELENSDRRTLRTETAPKSVISTSRTKWKKQISLL